MSTPSTFKHFVIPPTKDKYEHVGGEVVMSGECHCMHLYNKTLYITDSSNNIVLISNGSYPVEYSHCLGGVGLTLYSNGEVSVYDIEWRGDELRYSEFTLLDCTFPDSLISDDVPLIVKDGLVYGIFRAPGPLFFTMSQLDVDLEQCEVLYRRG